MLDSDKIKSLEERAVKLIGFQPRIKQTENGIRMDVWLKDKFYGCDAIDLNNFNLMCAVIKAQIQFDGIRN